MADIVREIPGAVGPLECLIDRPKTTPRAAVVFAHPLPIEGGTMHTKVVYQSAKALSDIGCVVLRFNFRGVGRSAGEWDEGRGEMDDYRTAVDYIAAAHPGLDLWAAGFSFGSWVALEAGAADPRVSTLIAIAPPVARDGYSFPNTLASEKPKFLIQGAMDELCPVKSLWAFYARLHEPKEIVLIDGANHLFEGQTEEVGEALEGLLGDTE